jgi:copper homeostasis protein
MKKIEIIATGLKDIISLNEIQEPIEIELCGHMEHDGLTLNIYEVVKCVNESIHPVRVMIRTHNNGFNVSSEDINRMIDDIKYITKYCNPAGFVYGFLSDDQKKINLTAMEEFQLYTGKYDNTFHKAIDLLIGELNIDCLKELGMNQVLTQGGITPVIENIEIFEKLTKISTKVIIGGGLTMNNYQSILKFADKLHFGRAVRINNSYNCDYDKQLIKKIIVDINGIIT